MLRILKIIINIVLALYASNALACCKPIHTDGIRGKTSTIIASINLVDVVDDKVKVEIKIKNLNKDTISYFLPKIVPGTYQNNNYGKFIEDFKAFDKQGKALVVQKHGDNQWKINNAKQLNSITYWVNDTFDSEDTNDIFSPTGTNISKNENFVLNLYAFVGYFYRMKESKYKLFIKHPNALIASTSAMKITPEKPIKDTNIDTDFFMFERYADLVDSPIMYSYADNRVTFTISGIEVLLSLYANNSIHTATRLMPQMERMIRAQKNFLGDINSTKKYSILLYLSSSKADDAKGFGALEHNNSTVVVLPTSLSKEKLNAALTNVVSHEFFHIVTPLTIHAEEIHNFNYNNPKMSEHLWLYEGTTEYFSLLFQISQGLITKEDFFERILGKIEASKEFDNTVSFTNLSKNILVEPYHKNYRNVYEKGALLSMCIDIIMREKSNGAYGILDLIKNLSQEFGIETPFKDKKLFKKIKELSYTEVYDFLKNHVRDNQPVDYDFYFKKVGLKYGVKNIESSYFIYKQQPYVKGSEGSQEIIFELGTKCNSFLKNMGIINGDVLLSINDKAYTIKNIYDLFGDSKRWTIGDKITFRIKRNTKEMTLTSTATQPTVEEIILEQDLNASEMQVNLFKNWIND